MKYTTQRNSIKGNLQFIKKQISKNIQSQKFIRNKLLKRKIFLTKFLEITLTRKDAKKRLSLFDCGLDIIKNSHNVTQVLKRGKNCYEIIGFNKKSECIVVHVREDIEEKDKKLFLISIFKK